jgi:hypothetical protein
VSSVIVEFDPYAKTGNRLCQFAFGKILSERKNVPFFSLPIPGFCNTFNHNKQKITSLQRLETITYGAHHVNYEELLSTDKTIIVNSYLQKYSYYLQHLDFLRNLFKIDASLNEEENNDELVIHIRGTDYLDGNMNIDDHLYLDMLNKIAPSKAALVTDDLNANIVNTLNKNGVKVVTKSNQTNYGNGLNDFEIYDFLYMLNAKHLLISQSTFSWWASFLGHQSTVYVPFIKNKTSMWWKLNPGLDDIDLIPLDSKYKKIIYER